MKKILLASVAALGLAGMASAAELDVRAPAALPLPIFTWTGCYLGINGGWIGDTSDITTSRRINPGFADPGRAPTTAVNLVTHSYKDNDSNGTFGGQFGCQYQWGWFVLGGEWDANWSGEKKDNYFAYPRVTDPATGFFWAPRTELTHTQLDWFSTARVRIGAAWWDRLLLYATGGLAFGAVDAYTQVATNEGGTNPFFSPSYFGAFRQDRIGWTAGGGFEWAFAQNWTAKAEFLSTSARTAMSRRARLSARCKTASSTAVRGTPISTRKHTSRVSASTICSTSGRLWLRLWRVTEQSLFVELQTPGFGPGFLMPSTS